MDPPTGRVVAGGGGICLTVKEGGGDGTGMSK